MAHHDGRRLVGHLQGQGELERRLTHMTGTPARVQLLFLSGHAALESGDVDGARELLTRAIEEARDDPALAGPQAAGAADLLGGLAAREGNRAEAERHYRAALRWSPSLEGTIGELTEVSLAELLIQEGTQGALEEGARLLTRLMTRQVDFHTQDQRFHWCVAAAGLHVALGDDRAAAEVARLAIDTLDTEPSPLTDHPDLGRAIADPESLAWLRTRMASGRDASQDPYIVRLERAVAEVRHVGGGLAAGDLAPPPPRGRTDYDRILADLMVAGAELTPRSLISDVVVTRSTASALVPILVRWFERSDSDPQFTDLVHALARRPVADTAMPLFIDRLHRELAVEESAGPRPDGRVEALVGGIAAIAEQRWADDLLSFAVDRRIGPARQVIVRALKKLRADPRVGPLLVSLLADEEVASSAIAAVAALGLQEAAPELEVILARHPSGPVRTAARKALAKLGRS